MINAGKAVASLILDTRNFKAGLESANAQLKVFSEKGATSAQKVKGVGGALSTIGGTLTKNLTVPLVGAGAATVKFSSDYESAFAGVRKTVDATEDEYKKLSDGIMDMSKKMPTAATEIAGVTEAAGQLGIQKDGLLSFTETMVMLGDSTNLSAESAASSLAKFANVTDMSQDKYSNLGSTIVALGNNFATTESDIVDMATYLSSTGNLVGLSQAQIMAVSTALSSCGINAEAGGSAVSKMLKKIDLSVSSFKESSKVIKSTGYSLRELEMLADQDTGAFKGVAASLGLTSDELKKYMSHSKDLQSFSDVAGVSAEQFVKAWGDDAVSALDMFITGLNDTERNGKSAVEILDSMGITEVRMSNAVLSLASSNGILTKSVNLANKAWDENTALSNEAEQRYGTFASQCSILWNKIKALGIEVGDALVPTVKDLNKTVSGVVSRFSSLDSGTKRMIVNMGLIGASVGPVTSVFGKLTQSVGGVMETTGKAVKAFKEANGILAGTKAALTSVISPAGMVVAGITALVGVGFALYNVYGKVEDKYADLDAQLKETAQSMKDMAEARQESYNSSYSEIYEIDRLKERLGELVDENGNVIGSKEELKGVIDKLNEHGFKAELNKTGDLIENYKELNKSIDEYRKKTEVQAKLDALKPEYNNNLVGVENDQYHKETADRQKDYEDELAKFKKYYGFEFGSDEYEEYRNKRFANGRRYADGGDFNSRVKSIQERANKVKEAAQQEAEAVELVKAVKEATALNEAGEYDKALARLEEYFQKRDAMFKRASDYETSQRKQAITDLGEQLNDEINLYKVAMDTGSQDLIDSQIERIQKAADELKKMGVEIPEGLVDGLKNGTISVDEAMKTISELIQNGTADVDLTDDGKRIGDTAATGISESEPAVKCASDSVAVAAAKTLTDQKYITAARNGGKSIGNALGEGIPIGIQAKIKDIINASRSAVDQAVAAAKKAANINSPSKKTRDLIGKPLAQGIGVGIEMQSSFVALQAAAATNSIMEEMQSALDRNTLTPRFNYLGLAADTAEALSGMRAANINYSQYPASDYGDKLDRLIDAVERLADAQTDIEVDGRSFGRLVREYV